MTAGILIALLIPSIFAPVSLSQNPTVSSNLRIRVQANIDKTDGGTEGSSAVGSGPVQVSKSTAVLLSLSKEGDMVCGFHASSGGQIRPDANLAWTATITPTRVQGEEVTFRLRWARAVSEGKPSSEIRGDEEITLRPGQSLMLDYVRRPNDARCGISGATLVVKVEREPSGWQDAQLLQTDLWLVEHLPNGKEDSQHLTLRSQMYVATPFFFDAFQAGGKSVDFHGEFTVKPGVGYLEVQLFPKRRVSEPGPPVRPISDFNSKALMRLKPEDVGSWEAPDVARVSDPLAGRQFSLRLRVRQIR